MAPAATLAVGAGDVEHVRPEVRADVGRDARLVEAHQADAPVQDELRRDRPGGAESAELDLGVTGARAVAAEAGPARATVLGIASHMSDSTNAFIWLYFA